MARAPLTPGVGLPTSALAPMFNAEEISAKLARTDEASYFKHAPLDLTGNEMRVLEILPPRANICLVECTIRHVTFKDRYNCLSYTWGSESANCVLKINGGFFRVRRNLRDFLCEARRQRLSAALWIDAICINQQDTLERTHQVKLMGQIYRGASQVLIWLGTPARTDPIKPLLAQRQHMMSGGNPQRLRRLLDLINAFDYWSRVWVIQEVLLARTIKILVGAFSFPFQDLVAMALLDNHSYALTSRHYDHSSTMNRILWQFSRHKSQVGMIESSNRLRRMIQAMRAETDPSYWAPSSSAGPSYYGDPPVLWEQSELDPAKSFELRDLLDLSALSRCSEPLDRIYAMMGLTRELDDLKVRYDITPQALAALVLAYEERCPFTRLIHLSTGLADGLCVRIRFSCSLQARAPNALCHRRVRIFISPAYSFSSGSIRFLCKACIADGLPRKWAAISFAGAFCTAPALTHAKTLELHADIETPDGPVCRSCGGQSCEWCQCQSFGDGSRQKWMSPSSRQLAILKPLVQSGFKHLHTHILSSLHSSST
jgi:hypothetical protein